MGSNLLKGDSEIGPIYALLIGSSAMIARTTSILFLLGFSLTTITLALGLQQLWVITWWPFQHEFREGAMAATTFALRLGLNPFSLEHQPQFANVYGPLYPALVALFTSEPQNSFVVARVMSSVGIIANSLLLGWWVARVCSPLLAFGVGTLFLYHQLDASSGAFPMSLGMLFLVAPISWIDVWGGSVRRVMGGALFGGLAFMTKPYFVVVSVIMGLVSLTHLTVRQTYLYGLLAVVTLSAVLLAYAHLFPAVWINTILHHMAIVRFDPQYRSAQITVFVRQTWPLWCSLEISLFIVGYRCIGTRDKSLWLLPGIQRFWLPPAQERCSTLR